MSRKHFTTKEVAEMYATDDHVVRKWIRQGRLKAINLGLGTRPSYRISEDELARFEAANSTSAA